MYKPNEIQFAASTFYAKNHPGESCGSNGLPLTPSSITILGRAQKLLTMEHKNLCSHIDIIRGKHERIIVVLENIGISLKESAQLSVETILIIGYQISEALNYLHRNGIIHRTLSLDNIFLYNKNKVKLLNYGLFYMTDGGKDVAFPLGLPKYLSPETILKGGGPMSDVWTLGIILLELCLGPVWSNLRPGPVLRRILTLVHTSNPAERIAREHDKIDKYQTIPEELKAIIEKCLRIYPSERITSSELANKQLWHQKNEIENDVKESGLLSCDLRFLYYWWQLAGGDIQAELKKQGLIKNCPPILSMPIAVLLDGGTIGGRTGTQMDRRIAKYSLCLLKNRLKHINPMDYYPLVDDPRPNNEAVLLPRIIRERDTEYQFHRLLLFRRLLQGYPYTAQLIRMEASIDIPPFLRGDVWSALLDVVGDIDDQYDRIDKESPTPTDRQIDVDIPRCHQYCWLLSGSAGHNSLKRILKAWLISNPHYVYWQGLDSLTAPFLYLNFNNEARAFACLSSFVPRFLHKFFLKDNSFVIKEYLAKFWQMTSFHEPVLVTHLHNIKFVPELFAIPWFLTMFSHVFPLHKIVHLWDAILVEGNSLPLFMGVAILRQLRDTLLEAGFNECILLFSDLPEIHIGHCVKESLEMCRSSPKSISYRSHTKQEKALDPKDSVEISANKLYGELSPRISCNDLFILLKEDQCLIIDIRSNLRYDQCYIDGSVNVPYSGVHLGVHNTSSLGEKPHNLIKSAVRDRKIIVIMSNGDDTEQLFSNYLVYCGVPRVSILHGGYPALKKYLPAIFVNNLSYRK